MSCMERANTDLPQGYYFGVSAGSGAVPDEFFLHYFSLFELKKGEGPKQEPMVSGASTADVKMVPAPLGNSELERLIKNMQSNINALVGPFNPADRNLFKRLSDIE